MEVVARYGGGGGVYGDDVAWRVGRIMLKYRPIAPKPATGGGALAAGPVDGKSGGGRGRKRGSCAKELGRGKKSVRRTAAAASVDAGAFAEEKKHDNPGQEGETRAPPVVTLPLMPETPDRKAEGMSPSTPSAASSEQHVGFGWPPNPVGTTTTTTTTTTSNSSGSSGTGSWSSSGGGLVVSPRPVRPVGSWVTVECVTDTWREGEVVLPLQATPAALERDACPVFVSDSRGEGVAWTNPAYRRMVVGPAGVVSGGSEEEASTDEQATAMMRVALVSRGLVPTGATCFTCRVRVKYARCGRRGGRVSVAAPCDVWRLADGRLAWRLDLKAALSLSLVLTS